MDETTLADPQVLDYLREHYVSIKIDIDDFDGFALKQQYAVETLPTMIFFASDGSPIGRVEEGIGAAELLEQLRIYNVSSNRRIVNSAAAVREADWSEPFAQMTNTYAEDERPTAPAEYVSSSIGQSDAAQPTAFAKTYPSQAGAPIPVINPTTTVPAAQTALADVPRMAHSVPAIEQRNLNSLALTANAAGLSVAEIEAPSQMPLVDDTSSAGMLNLAGTEVPRMSDAEMHIFSLQAGAFSSQGNAVRAADHLRDVTESPVLIEFDTINDKPVYRIYVGRFTDLEDAEALGRSLYMHGFSCIPKELAMR